MKYIRLAIVLAAGACGSAPEQASGRPNVLFLFADDQRPDAVGAFGNAHIRTPNMDRLVHAGFRFSSNYCMGSTGGAVCQPSRAMLMSGRTLYRVPAQLTDVVTLPELFGANGYTTFGTGKWHNGAGSFVRSFESARSVMFGGMSDHTRVPLRDLRADGELTEVRRGTGFSSEIFADAAIEFLEQYDGERPFFAYVAFSAPHDPRQPPQEYRDPYYEQPPPLPANFMPQHPFDNGWLVGRDETLAAWPRTADVISDQLAEYYALITHLDDQIGRILDALESSGQAENTVIVYAADHGLALGSHGLLGKQSVYEHSMGCPLVFRGPGIPRGESAALTYLFDIYPTLCQLAGIEIPASVEGASLKPIWGGDQARVRDTLFLTYEDLMRSVRDERYKLIRYPRIDHTQLFDLAADPDELVDLSAQPDQAQRVARMMDLLRDWQRRVADPHPLSIDEPQPRQIDLTGRARKPDVHQPQWIREKFFDAAESR